MASSRNKSSSPPPRPRRSSNGKRGEGGHGTSGSVPAPTSSSDGRGDLEATAGPEDSHPKQRQKLVRDSFTIPKGEYARLAKLKDRALRLIVPVKKSELLRAGIHALDVMPDKEFLATLDAIPSLKPGRPKNGGESSTETVPKRDRHRSKRR
jgi:hypothetical protein